MEHVKIEKRYADFLLALAYSWVFVSISIVASDQAWGNSHAAETPSKDSYEIIITAEENVGGSYEIAGKVVPPFYFALCKTNLSGSEVYTTNVDVLPYTGQIQPISTVDSEKGAAERREEKLTARATKYTRLLISTDKDALQAKIKNEANSDQKKKIVSKMVPPKIGSYCSGTITFIVKRDKKGKLSIQVDDKRTCTLFKEPISKKIKQVFKKGTQEPQYPSPEGWQ